MHSLEDIQHFLASHPVATPGTEQVALHLAAGRVSTQTIKAAHELPDFDNSAMDGYAIAMRPEQPLGPFRLVGYAAAGAGERLQIAAGESVRVLTGAPLPLGCQGVVPQEQVKVEGDQVHLDSPLCYGAHMRLRGSELSAGSVLLYRGERLRPLQVGLLATQGHAALEVYRRPVIGVLSTGSELQALGQPLAPGQIYDANRPQLLALAARAGAEVLDLGWVPDDLEVTRERLQAAAGQCDIIISSGGASVGEADHVRTAVEALGAISHWQVAIKPGKPFAFGHVQGKPFLGLPGNPVAAAITFLLLARPFIQRACGETMRSRLPCYLPLAESVENMASRRQFLRARLLEQEGQRCVQAYEQQGSAALASLAEADVLLEIPERTRLAAGMRVRCHHLFELAYA
ncbi:molybdopterin molybdenumtransferase MoeA [Chitinimonas prasina]|uniref:Molybdopterin molybdenumtransferase n=1 Tax=Chitinimonas prasina TaxID=1434937 RepID=A0ABQ5YIT4_9NEIS|nr:gephyrin-like molybdotransferase Glp [Chitinimonas prasina]GLR14925.1 molybdopterin molybdenumtransferase MoeA [Chitinimonas prasina]